MRRLLLPILVLTLLSVTVSAETYIITGRATYADNSQVQLYDITIDCEPGESKCLQFNGAKLRPTDMEISPWQLVLMKAMTGLGFC